MKNKLFSLLSGFSQKYIMQHTIFALFLDWQENIPAENLTSTILPRFCNYQPDINHQP